MSLSLVVFVFVVSVFSIKLVQTNARLIELRFDQLDNSESLALRANSVGEFLDSAASNVLPPRLDHAPPGFPRYPSAMSELCGGSYGQ